MSSKHTLMTEKKKDGPLREKTPKTTHITYFNRRVTKLTRSFAEFF